MIVDGQSGMLVPPNDAPALTRALVTLLTDGELRERMATGARRRAEEFSLERRRSDLLTLLHMRMDRSRESLKHREQLSRSYANGKGAE
jgi:hypothetical protein